MLAARRRSFLVPGPASDDEGYPPAPPKRVARKPRPLRRPSSLEFLRDFLPFFDSVTPPAPARPKHAPARPKHARHTSAHPDTTAVNKALLDAGYSLPFVTMSLVRGRADLGSDSLHPQGASRRPSRLSALKAKRSSTSSSRAFTALPARPVRPN